MLAFLSQSEGNSSGHNVFEERFCSVQISRKMAMDRYYICGASSPYAHLVDFPVTPGIKGF